MTAEETYKKVLLLSKYWLKELDYYGANQFKKKANKTDWSVGQLYDHILVYSIEVHIKAIQTCLQAKGTPSTKEGKTLSGTIQFALGSYLPFKYKSNPYIEPSQPLSPEKVKDDFYRFLKVIYKAGKEIDYKKSTNKVNHPRLGYLSADEWFQLIEMHMRHHMRQKKKLDKEMRSNFKETDVRADFDDIPDMPFHE